MRYGSWAPYVPVGQKKANARRFADKLAKKQKRDRQPIENVGRKIANSFWGEAWCEHLESFSDYANRLPRGATYIRNGSVVDLVIQPGRVDAIVAGSEPYKVAIEINKLSKKTWNKIKQDCSSAIDSLIDLLGGRLSDGVMQRLTDKKSGCFPSAGQIEMGCSCPDWSFCCKHIAAVMYAVGNRLDTEPELLFLLRGVDQQELISHAISQDNLESELSAGPGDIDGGDLESIFGIEMDSLSPVETDPAPKRSRSRATTPQKTAAAKKLAASRSSSKKPTSKTGSARRKPLATRSVKKKTAKRKATTKIVATGKKSSAKKKASTKKTTAKNASAKKKVKVTKKKKKKASVKKKAEPKKAVKHGGKQKRTPKQSAPKKKLAKRAGVARPSSKKKAATGKSPKKKAAAS